MTSSSCFLLQIEIPIQMHSSAAVIRHVFQDIPYIITTMLRIALYVYIYLNMCICILCIRRNQEKRYFYVT